MAPRAELFERMVWKPGHMLLDDLVFRVEDDALDVGELAGKESFGFLKPKRMIDQYAKFWSSKSDFSPQNIIELGIHEGGGIVFWFEYFHPKKLVALDIKQTGDSRLFRDYVTSRGLGDRVKTYWGTSQADVERLKQIVAADFSGLLDLVIDDASHLYEFTKISFETLFPLLRPGGLYIIEDWSWACWPGLPADFNPSMTELPASGLSRAEMQLPTLIFEIVEATGKMADFLTDVSGFLTLKPLIASVCTFADFIVIERGEADAAALGEFKLPKSSSDFAAFNELKARHADLSARYDDLWARHVPLTYLSGILPEAARLFWRKIKRILSRLGRRP